MSNLLASISKAIAGGAGAALSKVLVTIAKHYLPNLDAGTQQSIEYLIYTIITGLSVYAAPANKQV